MPFDLKLHYLPDWAGEKWHMEGPSWLEKAPLPISKELVREFESDGYRDRYLLLSVHELRNWHEEIFSKIRESSIVLKPHHAKQLAEFEAHVGTARDSSVYIAHWYEWESGL